MKRWIWILTLSLAVGVGLTWLARPLEVQVRWGQGPDQSASVSLKESLALAEWTPDEHRAIEGARSLSRAFTAIAREVSPSVVTIHSERNVAVNHPWGNRNPFGGMFPFFEMPDRVPQRGMGSGVIVSRDGKVLTNNHVVSGADRVKVTLSDERTFDAKVVGTDPKSDIAVLQIEASDLPAAKIGDSDAIEVGEWVLAIGNPFELSQTVTAGIVSAKGRSSVGLADYEDFIQTDAAINPGNSGGALVNLDGELVGINTAIATRSGGSQGVGFAIPVKMAGKIMDSLVRHGKVVRGYLGVTIQNVDAAIADNYGLDRPGGALVNSVANGSPADDAGVEAGDLIVDLEGRPVKDRDDLRLRVGEMSPGETVDLTVIRDGKRKSMKIKLAELPSDEALAGSPAEEPSGGSKLDDLGATVQRIDSEARQRFEIDRDLEGLIVVDVAMGSPAADSGLREGDVIIEAGREPVSSLSDLNDKLESVPEGRTLLLKVRREDANIFLALRVPKS